MAVVTYLLGAGASVGAVPVVANMPKRIGEFIGVMSDQEYTLAQDEFYPDINDHSKWDIQQEFIKDLKWLHEIGLNHETYDLYARKLAHRATSTDLRELERLKRTMSTYLSLEQAAGWDARYEAFLSSIAKGRISYADNVRILSWNYDFQLEKAYSRYFGTTTLYDAQAALNVVSKHSDYTYDVNKFAVYKLNGTAGVYQHSRRSEYPFHEQIPHALNRNVVSTVLRTYHLSKALHMDIRSTLSYAWEPPFKSSGNVIDLSKQAVRATNTLIVIGYSFPPYNRETDAELIRSMPNLQRVFIQTMHPKEVMTNFFSIKERVEVSNIIHWENNSRFMLPSDVYF